jgi:hypothetical protein
LTDEATCEANEGCVAVYVSPACGCSQLGCCQHFDHCTESPVQCYPGPHSECPPDPECKLGYTFVYDGGCPIGCVALTYCPPGD